MRIGERSLLRNRDVVLVAASVGVSALGDWSAIIALVLEIEDMTESGLAVSAIFICLWAPVVVLAGHAGVLVDRFETTRLLAVVSAAQALVAVGLAFVDAVASILALTTLLGIGFAISQAAEFSLVPAVAGRERIHEANGHVETARYAGFVAGPACGSVLAATGGIEFAMLVNAASFVAVAGAAIALRTRRPPRAKEAGTPPIRARDGVAFLFRQPGIALAMAVAFGSLLFMSASIPADVIYVEEVLGVEDLGLGTVYTLWTIGMLLGSLVLAKRVPVAALAAVAFVAVAVQGLGKALAPLWLAFAFMVACYFVGGVGHGLKNVCFRSLIHHAVPEQAHGRAAAAYNGLRNGAELGALVAGGLLVSAVGARGTLWLAGGLAAAAGLAGLALLRRLERAPRRPGARPAPETPL